MAHWGDSNLYIANQENANILFYANGAERLRIQAGGGISFNEDTAAANALDDYEEGTWTPDFENTSTKTGSGSGTYTKIGNICMCTFALSYTALTGTNTATMTGLPFTVASTETNVDAFAVQDMGHTLNTVSTNNGRFRVIINEAKLQGVKTLGSTTYMTYNEFYDGSGTLQVRGKFIYRTA